MTRSNRKKVAAELEDVRRILRRWDPIGVFPNPESPEGPIDEYDSYAPGILKQLQGGADVFKLSRHLSQLATGSMGLSDNPALHRRFAQELFKWWSSQRESAA
jgi:hypothetical protein